MCVSGVLHHHHILILISVSSWLRLKNKRKNGKLLLEFHTPAIWIEMRVFTRFTCMSLPFRIDCTLNAFPSFPISVLISFYHCQESSVKRMYQGMYIQGSQTMPSTPHLLLHQQKKTYVVGKLKWKANQEESRIYYTLFFRQYSLCMYSFVDSKWKWIEL